MDSIILTSNCHCLKQRLSQAPLCMWNRWSNTASWSKARQCRNDFVACHQSRLKLFIVVWLIVWDTLNTSHIRGLLRSFGGYTGCCTHFDKTAIVNRIINAQFLSFIMPTSAAFFTKQQQHHFFCGHVYFVLLQYCNTFVILLHLKCFKEFLSLKTLSTGRNALNFKSYFN